MRSAQRPFVLLAARPAGSGSCSARMAPPRRFASDGCIAFMRAASPDRRWRSWCSLFLYLRLEGMFSPHPQLQLRPATVSARFDVLASDWQCQLLIDGKRVDECAQTIRLLLRKVRRQGD